MYDPFSPALAQCLYILSGKYTRINVPKQAIIVCASEHPLPAARRLSPEARCWLVAHAGERFEPPWPRLLRPLLPPDPGASPRARAIYLAVEPRADVGCFVRGSTISSDAHADGTWGGPPQKQSFGCPRQNTSTAHTSDRAWRASPSWPCNVAYATSLLLSYSSIIRPSSDRSAANVASCCSLYGFGGT